MMVDVRVPCVCVFGLSVRHYLFLFIARVFTLSVSCFTALHSSVAFVGRLRERRTRSIWGVTTPSTRMHAPATTHGFCQSAGGCDQREIRGTLSRRASICPDD